MYVDHNAGMCQNYAENVNFELIEPHDGKKINKSFSINANHEWYIYIYIYIYI